MRQRERSGLVHAVLVGAAVVASSAPASERELEQDSPPNSAREIETSIERVFPEEPVRPPLVPWFGQQLQKLPPFFADTHLEVHFRTYYLRKDRVTDELSEAWAAGGSIAYRSGWLADLFQAELEAFTSQPIVAPDSRDGTLLLAPGQEGYGVLGIAKGKLRYEGIVLTGFRQYLDLPYLNRNDFRMTPNTFEAITLARPEGNLVFSAGYAWNIKLRNEDEFRSFTEVLGLEEDRGLAHGGAIWEPHEDFHVGTIVGAVPDLFVGAYAELGVERNLADAVEGRLDVQLTYQGDIGDDLLGDDLDETWNLGTRASTSYRGFVFRLGFSITGSGDGIFSPYGADPSYVELMQRTFNRADEKALLASLSYDFAGLGLDGLTGIVNFVAAFDGRLLDERSNAQEIDVTFDYRIEKGWLESFWLRLRGSWLIEEATSKVGTDYRVILRYDLPVL